MLLLSLSVWQNTQKHNSLLHMYTTCTRSIVHKGICIHMFALEFMYYLKSICSHLHKNTYVDLVIKHQIYCSVLHKLKIWEFFFIFLPSTGAWSMRNSQFVLFSLFPLHRHKHTHTQSLNSFYCLLLANKPFSLLCFIYTPPTSTHALHNIWIVVFVLLPLVYWWCWW